MDKDLPENLLKLLRQSIPTYPAAEFLLLIRQVGAFHSAEELSTMRQPPAKPKEVEAYLATFRAAGLIEFQDGAYRFAPANDDLRNAVEALATAYNEKPVTLIRTIYDLAGGKIQSFADAFKISET